MFEVARLIYVGQIIDHINGVTLGSVSHNVHEHMTCFVDKKKI